MSSIVAFEPDFAVDRLPVDAGFGEHHRHAVAVVVGVGDAVQADRIFGAALADLVALHVELPIAVRVVVEAEDVGRSAGLLRNQSRSSSLMP